MKASEKEQIEQTIALMFWKLCLGNPNHVLHGEVKPTFNKMRHATVDTCEVHSMPDDGVSHMELALPLYREEMEILRMGHIPEAQEDNWFMYCTDEHIRYFRSWTGDCMYEAHFHQDGDDYIIDNLVINHALMEFGINNDQPAAWLFRYLLTTEIGGDSDSAWQEFVDVWLDYNT